MRTITRVMLGDIYIHGFDAAFGEDGKWRVAVDGQVGLSVDEDGNERTASEEELQAAEALGISLRGGLGIVVPTTNGNPPSAQQSLSAIGGILVPRVTSAEVLIGKHFIPASIIDPS